MNKPAIRILLGALIVASGMATAAAESSSAATLSQVGAMANSSRGLGSITTLFAGGNGQAGNMFDMTVIGASPVTITSFDIHVDNTNAHTAEVYYVTGGGSYVGNETNSGAWTMMGSVGVTGAGVGNPTPLPVGGLTINPGETYGLYVTMSTCTCIDYTNGPLGPYSNADVQLTLGTGNAYPFGNTFSPRIWNGTVYYDIQAQDADLELTKSASLTTIPAGGTLTYTLTVTNNGPGPANNTVVVDDLPAEFSWSSDDCGAGPPAGGPPNGTLTWNVGNLSNGAGAVCNVTGTVDGANGTPVVNNASAASDSTDPTPATASITVLILQNPLEIPTLSGFGLLLLLLLIAATAVWALRRTRQA